VSDTPPIVSIDPGATGAGAILYSDHPERVAVFDMPTVSGEVDAHALRAVIETYGPSRAIIELVGPMPRDGVKQAWRFSAAFTTARVHGLEGRRRR
jgi:hypothetical protein